MSILNRVALLSLFTVVGCSDVEEHDHDHHDHEHEVMTTVVLTFTSQADGTALEYIWADVENDGDPVIDDVFLAEATDYEVGVQLWNELEDPMEDVTPEIQDEADEHQVFFTGDAVEGPATGENADAILLHDYADEDANGLPLGLLNTVSTLGHGTGDLVVTLRHMPPENDQAIKVEGLADTVATEGFGAIGGANDVSVTFAVEVEHAD